MYYYCIIYDAHATDGSAGDGQTGERDIVGIVLIAASHGWCSTPYTLSKKFVFMFLFFSLYTVLYVRKIAYQSIYVFFLQNFRSCRVTILSYFVILNKVNVRLYYSILHVPDTLYRIQLIIITI